MSPSRLLAVSLAALTVACSGGGGSPETPEPPQPPQSEPTNPSEPAEPVQRFASAASTSRFLTMGTFGPKPDDVAALTGTSASDWLKAELAKPASPYLAAVLDYAERGERPRGVLSDGFDQGATSWVFWRNAVHGDDQLRQRMIYALSQILVVSNGSGGLLGIFPQTLGYYQEILSEHAFGNYRDLLEDVTYSPAMAEYLTYLGNQKGDPATGRVPDENYAREILQLFTIGLVELNPDGTPVLGADGEPVELYDNDDITGLARVFTGLDEPDLDLEAAMFGRRYDDITAAARRPVPLVEARHSDLDKTFLGTTIPAGTPGRASIDQALDHIMAHPNVGPFVGRQLIQRFVTSDPEPAYVARVAAAFDAGRFTLPDGSSVGAGRKGDLAATLAAVLFDPATDPEAEAADDFGKVREPILRVSHLLRAFDADMTTPEYAVALYDTSPIDVLAQHPFRSPSVFNFYRPGYVAPGTVSGERGLTTPELQIVNASSTAGALNMISFAALGTQAEAFARARPLFLQIGVPFDEQRARATFVPDYAEELPLAGDPAALVAHLDDLLLYGTMTDGTRAQLTETLAAFPADALTDPATRELFVGFAVTLVMASPDYLVQR